MLKFFPVFLFLFCAGSVSSQTTLSGCYTSNFAIIGWFGTQLKFTDDQRFEYLFAGDLFYDKINGTYEIEKNRIILNYSEKRDTMEITMSDSTGKLITHRFPEPENNAANYRPSQLKVKGSKLIIYDREGKIVRWKMNSKEKWRRYYLIKISCEQMIPKSK